MQISMLRRIPVVAATLAAFALAGCGSDTPTETQADIIATAQAAGQFNTLLTAVEAAGLTSTLRQGGPFTVFAPTDAAFAALPPGTVEALLNDVDALRAILLFHVVEGQVTSTQAAQLSAAPTLNGQELSIARVNGGLQVGGANVVAADVQASNGVIHVVDAVLLP